MRVGGDAGLSAVPILTRSICGIAFDGSGGPLTMKCRDYYIRCNTTVPLWRQLTIDGNVRLAFMNDSKITSWGTLYGHGGQGQIRLVSAKDSSKGMKFTGQIRVRKGGWIKIYE